MVSKKQSFVRYIFRDKESIGYAEVKPKFKLFFDSFSKLEIDFVLWIVLTSKNYKDYGYDTIVIGNRDIEEGIMNGNSYINFSKNNDVFDKSDMETINKDISNGRLLKKAKIKHKKMTKIINSIKKLKKVNTNFTNYLRNIVELEDKTKQYEEFTAKYNI